jgi:hypothetical protein
VIRVNPRFTSQKCFTCGDIVQKSLSVRTHMCPFCGSIADRDVNAAQNILKVARPGHGLQERTYTAGCRVSREASAFTLGELSLLPHSLLVIEKLHLYLIYEFISKITNNRQFVIYPLGSSNHQDNPEYISIFSFFNSMMHDYYIPITSGR